MSIKSKTILALSNIHGLNVSIYSKLANTFSSETFAVQSRISSYAQQLTANALDSDIKTIMVNAGGDAVMQSLMGELTQAMMSDACTVLKHVENKAAVMRAALESIR